MHEKEINYFYAVVAEEEREKDMHIFLLISGCDVTEEGRHNTGMRPLQCEAEKTRSGPSLLCLTHTVTEWLEKSYSKVLLFQAKEEKSKFALRPTRRSGLTHSHTILPYIFLSIEIFMSQQLHTLLPYLRDK